MFIPLVVEMSWNRRRANEKRMKRRREKKRKEKKRKEKKRKTRDERKKREKLSFSEENGHLKKARSRREIFARSFSSGD